MFYGSIIFRFFGVLVVWLLRLLYSLITRKKIKTFLEIWKGSDYDDLANSASYEMKFIVIGFIFLMIVCWYLAKIHL